MLDEAALGTLLRVAHALDAVGARFMVGGSLASSLQGIPRSTRDVDLVADLRAAQVAGFVSALGKGFYADDERILLGIRASSSFNVIDLQNGFKADIYLLGTDRFAHEQLARAVAVEIEPGRRLPFASPEDIILHKLLWYRMGGQTSERQWLDVLGVLKVQGAALDRDYLRKWAHELRIEDLLQRVEGDLL